VRFLGQETLYLSQKRKGKIATFLGRGHSFMHEQLSRCASSLKRYRLPGGCALRLAANRATGVLDGRSACFQTIRAQWENPWTRVGNRITKDVFPMEIMNVVGREEELSKWHSSRRGHLAARMASPQTPRWGWFPVGGYACFKKPKRSERSWLYH
jgi:hypothetical protein